MEVGAWNSGVVTTTGLNSGSSERWRGLRYSYMRVFLYCLSSAHVVLDLSPADHHALCLNVLIYFV
jgi:hypothetical protein